jgi:hypothetical protein
MQKLPIIKHKGKRYFIDFRLREFRPMEPPIEFIPFDSELGREIDKMPEFEEQYGLENEHISMECSTCGKVLFKGTEKEARKLIIYCTDCCCWKKKP